MVFKLARSFSGLHWSWWKERDMVMTCRKNQVTSPRKSAVRMQHPCNQKPAKYGMSLAVITASWIQIDRFHSRDQYLDYCCYAATLMYLNGKQTGSVHRIEHVWSLAVAAKVNHIKGYILQGCLLWSQIKAKWYKNYPKKEDCAGFQR